VSKVGANMKLKSFNSKKALHQLKNKHKREYNVKNRTIILSVLILILSIIFLTYARYESNSNEFTIIDAQVDDFSGDVKIISYNYDDGSGKVSAHSVPPTRDSGYKINTVNCDNARGTWNNAEWGLDVRNITGKVKCNLTFDLIIDYSDEVIVSTPELYDGLIPVTIESNGTVKVADTSTKWYNYSKRKWANAVIVSNPSSYIDISLLCPIAAHACFNAVPSVLSSPRRFLPRPTAPEVIIITSFPLLTRCEISSINENILGKDT
jgi:hypothetical protein